MAKIKVSKYSRFGFTKKIASEPPTTIRGISSYPGTRRIKPIGKVVFLFAAVK